MYFGICTHFILERTGIFYSVAGVFKPWVFTNLSLNIKQCYVSEIV